MQYNQFLFAMLVKDNVIEPNNLSIPYDLLKGVIDEHFAIFTANDSNMEISAYEAIENYLNVSGSLLAELYAINEEYSGAFTHTCPQCQSKFNYNSPDSSHQVNDNNEVTYCSYACSAINTLHILAVQFGDDEEVTEIIENT